jgi:hypothetical protein
MEVMLGPLAASFSHSRASAAARSSSPIPSSSGGAPISFRGRKLLKPSALHEKACGRRRARCHFGLKHRGPGQIDAIGVDEIQYAKGQKYLTLVYQIDFGVMHLLLARKEGTVESRLRAFLTDGFEIRLPDVRADKDHL